MLDMEYRGWITVPHLDVESADAERFLVVLEDCYGDFGPVLSGAGDAVQVVLLTDSNVEADAAREMYAVTTGALRLAGLADRYVSALEIEPVPASAPVAAAS